MGEGLAPCLLSRLFVWRVTQTLGPPPLSHPRRALSLRPIHQPGINFLLSHTRGVTPSAPTALGAGARRLGTPSLCPEGVPEAS